MSAAQAVEGCCDAAGVAEFIDDFVGHVLQQIRRIGDAGGIVVTVVRVEDVVVGAAGLEDVLHPGARRLLGHHAGAVGPDRVADVIRHALRQGRGRVGLPVDDDHAVARVVGPLHADHFVPVPPGLHAARIVERCHAAALDLEVVRVLGRAVRDVDVRFPRSGGGWIKHDREGGCSAHAGGLEAHHLVEERPAARVGGVMPRAPPGAQERRGRRRRARDGDLLPGARRDLHVVGRAGGELQLV